MRTILLLLVFSAQLCCSQSVHFEPSLEVAFKKASLQNKLVFIEYYNSDCPVCKKVEPLFDNPEIATLYNANFINYKLNTKQALTGYELEFLTESGLQFQSVPFFLFFDSDKNFVHYSGVRAEVNYLLEIGKTALKPLARTGSLREKYEKGDRSIRTLYAYANLVQLYQNEKLQNEITATLFAHYPKENLGSEQSYLILKNVVLALDNGFYRYWYENRAKLSGFEKESKAGTELKQLERILLHAFNRPEKQLWTLEQIAEVKEMITTLGLSANPNDFLWETEAQAFYSKKKSAEALLLFKEVLQAAKTNPYASLYITDFFLNLFQDKKELDVVKSALEKLAKTTTENDLKATLLYQEIIYYTKIKDFKTAETLKTKALEFYKKHQLDLSPLDEI